MSSPRDSPRMSGDLENPVFRSLEFALMAGAPELTYQDGMQVLEAIRILREAARQQDELLRELAERIRENNELLRQLIEVLAGWRPVSPAGGTE